MTLVIYYSRKGENYWNGSLKNLEQGNTQKVAAYIREAAGADLFEVETVNTYDASYMKCIEQAKAELRDNARPELKQYLDDIALYDKIVIAGPCWWGTYPMAIFSQLERLDFSSKTVYPVMTHEGSGIAGAPAALKKYCKGAIVGEGLAIHGADTEASAEQVKHWAEKNLK